LLRFDPPGYVNRGKLCKLKAMGASETVTSQDPQVPQRTPPQRPPLVLIANDQEWSTRSLESILWPNGYAVLRAYTGRKALERSRSAQPDLIIIDTSLPDIDSLALCEALRTEAHVHDSTPIIMTAPVRPSRQQRLAALRAGAWEFLNYPLDAEELMLRLDGYMRAKFDADRAREDALLDEATGLYNIRGLERRARELGSHAFRNHWPLACVVVAPDSLTADSEEAARERGAGTTDRITTLLKSVFRISDVIGRLGENEFAIIASGTDSRGAMQLAKRLAGAMERDGGTGSDQVRIRVGYDAVADYHENPVELTDMLARATTALRLSRQGDEPDADSWIRPFEGDS
jgi:diguanylate cyclase (GGDEF)-like protein